MKDTLVKRLAKCWQFIKVHDALLAALIAVSVIAVGIAIGWSNDRLIPTYPNLHYHYTAEPGNPLSFMSNWDGPDYLSIVREGYHAFAQTNFFPLYPALIYVVSFVVRSPLMSALLISWCSLVGAIYFYIKILKLLGKVSNQVEAVRSAMFFVLFPTGVFLLASYTESLFALLALAAIYWALRRKYIWSAIALLLCTACHINGMFVVICATFILWEQKERLRNIAVTFCIGSLGLLGYMVYLLHKFHNAFAFIESQKDIHGWLKHGYISLFTTADSLNVLFIVLLVASTIYYWRRRRSFSVYSLLFLAIPLVGRQYGGFNRYVLMAFPVQFMLYEYLRDKKQIYPYVLAFMGVVWTYFTLQYAGGYIGS